MVIGLNGTRIVFVQMIFSVILNHTKSGLNCKNWVDMNLSARIGHQFFYISSLTGLEINLDFFSTNIPSLTGQKICWIWLVLKKKLKDLA